MSFSLLLGMTLDEAMAHINDMPHDHHKRELVVVEQHGKETGRRARQGANRSETYG